MKPQLLKGKKILVTSYDLEHSEHRGIAAYSKALISCLSEAGAEVWLLTEFFDHLSESRLKFLPGKTQSIIHKARILNSFAHGEKPTSVLERKFRLARYAKIFINKFSGYTRLLVKLLRRPKIYKSKDISSFSIRDLYDNPNLRIQRLDYMECVTGIVSAPDIYLSSKLAAKLPTLQPVQIDLNGFDALITTCPLNIRPINIAKFVQTIHDLIPLEYAPQNEDQLIFSHRLQACMLARRMFVSQSTANKYAAYIHTPEKADFLRKNNQTCISYETVIVQPPSLRFPTLLSKGQEKIFDIPPASYLFRDETLDLTSTARLTPFRYFLFNSSVESRKNPLFLVKAYVESGLINKGIKLCITGKLKNDQYSQSLKKILDYESGIILTDYVDESCRLDLYLNALGLLSPSLVEGFGIPVLDAACLGMPTLASDCKSHLEISALPDFAEHVLCLNTLASRKWAAAMQAVADNSRELVDQAAQIRCKRIARYCRFQSMIKNQLKKDLVAILN